MGILEGKRRRGEDGFGVKVGRVISQTGRRMKVSAPVTCTSLCSSILRFSQAGWLWLYGLWTHQRSLCPNQCMEAAVEGHERKGNGCVSGHWSGPMTNNQRGYPNVSNTLGLHEILGS